MAKFRWETESKQTEIREISREWEEEESSFRIPLLNPEILPPEWSYCHLCYFTSYSGTYNAKFVTPPVIAMKRPSSASSW